MARGNAVHVRLGQPPVIGEAPDLTPEEVTALAAQADQAGREERRRQKLRSLKAKFRAGTATAADRDKALAILCGVALQDTADDQDNGA